MGVEPHMEYVLQQSGTPVSNFGDLLAHSGSSINQYLSQHILHSATG
jgi:hypothetical protein